MSDLVETKHWDDGHNHLLEDCPWCEIERLRADNAQLNGTITGMDVGVERLNTRISELETINTALNSANTNNLNHIELLEKNYDRWAVGHIITTAQIDAAWAYAKEDDYAVVTLMKLGIERCEGCGGNKSVQQVEHSYGWIPCPDCDGRGWVVK